MIATDPTVAVRPGVEDPTNAMTIGRMTVLEDRVKKQRVTQTRRLTAGASSNLNKLNEANGRHEIVSDRAHQNQRLARIDLAKDMCSPIAEIRDYMMTS